MTDDDRLPTAGHELCGRCGLRALGFAERNGVRLCHGDHGPFPTCYTLDEYDRTNPEYAKCFDHRRKRGHSDA